MGLTKTFYKALAVAWFVVVFGAVISVDQGLAEPWLSISDVPGGFTGGIAIGIVAAFLGWMVISSRITRIERAEWREVGRQAGLRPAGDGAESGSELTGTIDGRTVSARYEKVNVESGE
ncbi:MAG: hypothetical protein ABEJ42_04825 [Halobacteriaceae archaeon]